MSPNPTPIHPDDLPELLPWEPEPTPAERTLQRVYETAREMGRLQAKRERLQTFRSVLLAVWKDNRQSKGLPWPPPGCDVEGRQVEE
jgi:hypothetical protein